MARFSLSLLMVALAACSYGGDSQSMSDKMDIRLPVTICLDVNDEIASELASGDARLRLTIRNRQISNSYSSAFQLSLLQDDGSRFLVHSFGMQPDIIIQGQAQPQMYLISLKNVKLPQKALGKVCFELSELPSDKAIKPALTKDVGLTWHTTTDD